MMPRTPSWVGVRCWQNLQSTAGLAFDTFAYLFNLRDMSH